MNARIIAFRTLVHIKQGADDFVALVRDVVDGNVIVCQGWNEKGAEFLASYPLSSVSVIPN
jgi:hypothetical protein